MKKSKVSSSKRIIGSTVQGKKNMWKNIYLGSKITKLQTQGYVKILQTALPINFNLYMKWKNNGKKKDNLPISTCQETQNLDIPVNFIIKMSFCAQKVYQWV